MKRSLFSRYFTLCASIILSSIAVLGVMLVTLSAGYFREDNLDKLEKKAVQASHLLLFNYERNFGEYVDASILNDSFSILSTAAEADVFFTDLHGKTRICSCQAACGHKTYLINQEVMQEALSGQYRGVTRLGRIYPESYYVVGIPVLAEGGVIGVLFTASSASAMRSFLSDVFRIFLVGALLVIMVSFVVVYFSTEALVRPLRAMVKATDSFAKGDFSQRVPVEGDDEIEQLAMAFNNMASSLAMLENTRRSFIANVSHELKTPMTTIGGFIDGILDGTIPPDQYDHYLGIVSQEVRRLSRMVVSMLNISRIEAGEMTLKPQQVDVNEIVTRTILGFEQRIEEKSIEVEGLDVEKMPAEADPDFLHQIAYNLIENAVKFTPQRGTISVQYKNDGKFLRVAIRNSGEGIPKEEIPHLFDRFYKSDRSRSIDTKGVGLGLHIVKSLVHLQGGEISVTSAPGEFTEFSFTVPAIAQKNNNSLFRKG